MESSFANPLLSVTSFAPFHLHLFYGSCALESSNRLMDVVLFAEMECKIYQTCHISMQRKQNTVTRDKHDTELIARGRHDPCVVPRGMPLSYGCFCPIALTSVYYLSSIKRLRTM